MIPVLFEDSEILVLDKPANLVTTSSETNSEPSLQDILAKDFKINIERSGIVHRLDKDTSGVIVVAKTMSAFENLQAQFKNRNTQKEYLALVHGSVEKEGVIDAAILRHPGDREKFTTLDQLKFGKEDLNAREAVTIYKLLELRIMNQARMEEIFSGFTNNQMKKLDRMHYSSFSLLAAFPQTGRTHQIRVHLKYLGNPIVADAKYGGRKVIRLDHRWCPRQFLHAVKLEINHPKTGERMKFESKLPEDLEKALGMLEKL